MRLNPSPRKDRMLSTSDCHHYHQALKHNQTISLLLTILTISLDILSSQQHKIIIQIQLCSICVQHLQLLSHRFVNYIYYILLIVSMSRQNSIEKRLLDNVTTLKKMLVDCEINGWMETNRKKLPSAKNKIFFRPKMRQKSTKLIPVEKLQTINDEIERDVSFKRLIFQKKENTNTCSTHCSNRIKKITLLGFNEEDSNRQSQAVASPQITTKPFNSGYVLKQLRKRGKQRSYLKKFNPVNSNSSMTKSECLEDLDTKDSIRYFQNHYKRLEVLSSRVGKGSFRL